MAAALGALAILLAAPGPVRAAGPSQWQASCAYRMPSGIPGSGWGIVADSCSRLQFCQRMEERGAERMMQMGCFGFAGDQPARAGQRR